MSLIVEDGSAKDSAQSYLDVTAVSAYLSARGMTSFTGLASDTLREAAILRGMRWLENRYRSRWKGRRTTNTQSLTWPRYGVKDADGWTIEHDVIPQLVKDALCEAAEREAAEAGSLSPDLERGGQVQSEKDVVGPIESSKTYFAGAPATTTFPAIEDMLRSLIGGSLNGNVTRT